ncbi:hypothetical protein HUO13_05405 [Saccharopolyspora erythraea]|uniref:hypothetical protein n=1 Tax=Saccharopolyspora erythraea TaxID=1836 RepID=UPI001BAB0E4C|nr:hypothetical protein [Saccharopolyspora erythraea]QUH00331.1 hypothetical protein HUO13_05405 [Saccharopolyspora erythraea]
MQNKEWKLKTPPDTEVAVAEDVLGMRVPLVRVRRDGGGGWSFFGPGDEEGPTKRTVLSAVVGAWPHVSALAELEAGSVAVWSWTQHGWTGEFECRCGECQQPVAADLDRKTWPSDLHPHHIVSVEQTALSGQVVLADIISTEGGIALLGPGEHRRTSEKMTPVAVANVIRRWPHTMHALRALNEGRGMRWNSEGMAWHEYVIA